MSKNVKRLIDQFQPHNYVLHLEPDKKKKVFKGHVVISGLKKGAPTKRLVFHQKKLKITSAKIINIVKNENIEIPVDRINVQASYDEVRIHSPQLLRAGQYTVELNFSGKITNNMSGMYLSTFKQRDIEKEMIVTQFESHHAREAFPCIDEPAAKATFDLSLTIPSGETVVANTPIKEQIKKGSDLITIFNTTPKMSTYLLAFAFGDLAFKETTSKEGVKIRTYATPDNLKFVDFALETAKKVLEFYNDYFGIDYPLEKCDLLAIPDFAAGAMENWGCITFREVALLVDDDNTTLLNKQHVALVIAHELAHQWFGNLVTMSWWTDLWLNEGFASWMEYFAIDSLYPEWNLWVQFAVDEQQRALNLDALFNTHPVEVEVKHPDEIRNIFDGISYSKGASVIQMLHRYVGAADFKNGLKYYLEKHAYSNTDTVDLWSALEEVSHKPVRKFMAIWTTKPGFPHVSAELNGNKLTLTQSRFILDPKKHPQTETIWPIPLIASDKDLPATLHDTTKKYAVDDSNNLKLNLGQTGFYRVTYNPTHLEKLGSQILRGHLKPLDRLGILSDVFEAAKSGNFDTAEALHFMNNFVNEDSSVVWEIISSQFSNLRMTMDSESLRDSMKPYIISLTSTQLARLGWDKKDSDSYDDRLLRPIIVGMSAAADEPAIVKKCLDLFNAIPVGQKTETKKADWIDPDLRGIVYTTAARLGGVKEFNKLLKLHNSSTMSEERTVLSGALSSFKQPELIEKALGLIKSKDVRLQDVGFWIAYCLLNRYAKKIAWGWLKENWAWLQKNLGSDMAFYRTPVYAAKVFSTDEFMKDYKIFFKPLLNPGLERPYKQGLEYLEYQIAWRKRSLKEVESYFAQTKSVKANIDHS